MCVGDTRLPSWQRGARHHAAGGGPTVLPLSQRPAAGPSLAHRRRRRWRRARGHAHARFPPSQGARAQRHLLRRLFPARLRLSARPGPAAVAQQERVEPQQQAEQRRVWGRSGQRAAQPPSSCGGRHHSRGQRPRTTARRQPPAPSATPLCRLCRAGASGGGLRHRHWRRQRLCSGRGLARPPAVRWRTLAAVRGAPCCGRRVAGACTPPAHHRVPCHPCAPLTAAARLRAGTTRRQRPCPLPTRTRRSSPRSCTSCRATARPVTFATWSTSARTTRESCRSRAGASRSFGTSSMRRSGSLPVASEVHVGGVHTRGGGWGASPGRRHGPPLPFPRPCLRAETPLLSRCSDSLGQNHYGWQQVGRVRNRTPALLLRGGARPSG